MGREMLYLSAPTLDRMVDRLAVVEAMEQAFAVHAAGEYEMPQRMHVNHQANTLLYMPCFVPEAFGTKLLTLFPSNRERQLPVIQGLMLLNDAETGAPLALIDGARLTALRTGGVGGVAIRHTTPGTASRLGLVGTGVQGWEQVLTAAAVRALQQVTVYDADPQRLRQFAQRLSAQLPTVPVAVAGSAQELLAQSEIVITATSSPAPVLPEQAELLRGKHFVAIGSYQPGMRELPAALYPLLRQVLVDTEHGLQETGDLRTPLERGWIAEEQVQTLGRWLHDREGLGETTLFKSVGMALFDLVLAQRLYQQARELGLGQNLED